MTTATVTSPAPATIELQQYRQEPRCNAESDALEWWRETGAKKYPHLAALARKYLAIPATSASSERLFSLGQHITQGRRNGLDPDYTASILFLKSNASCIPPVKES